jgi:hypothetical protein
MTTLCNMRVKVSTPVICLLLSMMGCGGGGGGNPGSDPPPAATTFKISGAVTSGGAGVAGATVKLGGLGSATAFTNTTGNFSFSGLANGSYTVTVKKPNFACTPKACTQTISSASLAGVNFTAVASPPVFYVIDDTKLAILDIGNRRVRIIGPTGNFLNDIAFDPSGHLFGISESQLFKVNLTSGATTLVGNSVGTGHTTSLVFSEAGNLYTANTSLYTINAQTGVGTLVGNGGNAYTSSGDLEYIGGNFYLTSILNGTTDALFRLDPATGVGTSIGQIGYPNVYGLSTNDDVTLYGFAGTKVISINPSTGAGTLVWDFGPTVNGALGAINGASFSLPLAVPITGP